MNRRPTYVKLTVFLVLAGIVGLMEFGTLTGPHVGTVHTYHAIFSGNPDGISGLHTGDAVKVSGVAVGKVTGTTLVDATHVKVTFTANDHQRLTTHTWAVVRYANLLGQRYLALSQSGNGPAGPLPDGTIPASRTAPALSLTALFNGFRPLFAALSPQQVNEISNDIVAILQGNTDTLGDLVLHVADLTQNLNQRNQVFSTVVDSLNRLLSTVARHDTQLAGVVTALRSLAVQGSADAPAILDSLGAVDGLVGSVGRLLGGVNQRGSFTQDVADLRSVTGVLANNRALLTKFISGFITAFGDFTRVTQNGNFIQIFPCNVYVKTRGALPVTPSNIVDTVTGELGGSLSSLGGALEGTLGSLASLTVPVPLTLPNGHWGRDVYSKVCQ